MSHPDRLPAGLLPFEIAEVRSAIVSWPGGWSADVVGAPDAAVVLIAAEGDRFAPALHLERSGLAIVVSACLWDKMITIGQFEDITAALDHIAGAVAGNGFSAALN